MLSKANASHDPLRNALLGALPVLDWSRLRPHLHPIEASAGTLLCEPDTPLCYAYFPTTSIVSMQQVTVDGASTEVASVGREGVFGITLLMGDPTTGSRAVVQSGGLMHRVRSEILIEEFTRGGALQSLLLRYTRALLALVAQGSVCNQRHSIDQHLCRWILLSLDRLATEELTMTHELLANTLGVRREGITEAARRLQMANLIAYHRGRISVVDRAGLEASCCECYRTMRQEYDRLLDGDAYTPQQEPLAARLRGYLAHEDRNQRIIA